MKNETQLHKGVVLGNSFTYFSLSTSRLFQLVPAYSLSQNTIESVEISRLLLQHTNIYFPPKVVLFSFSTDRFIYLKKWGSHLKA